MKTLSERVRALGSLELDANHLALDFCNTLEWRGGENPEEKLKSYDHFLAWTVRAGVQSLEAATLLDSLAGPEKRDHAIDSVRSARELLFRLFSAIADGRTPADADLASFSRALREAHAHIRLRPGQEPSQGFVTDFSPLPDEQARAAASWLLVWPLSPIVVSAAELLLRGDLKRVRRCANDLCGWIFLDTSKNGSRRWCSMTSCGNRAKARRHYHKERSDTG